jgi:hypothetical protein
MGRRPNQLILEYFERGPKLEDASNRYQHTCKSCGEKVRKAPPCESSRDGGGGVRVKGASDDG